MISATCRSFSQGDDRDQKNGQEGFKANMRFIWSQSALLMRRLIAVRAAFAWI